jgi:hypothetical protein
MLVTNFQAALPQPRYPCRRGDGHNDEQYQCRRSGQAGPLDKSIPTGGIPAARQPQQLRASYNEVDSIKHNRGCYRT